MDGGGVVAALDRDNRLAGDANGETQLLLCDFFTTSIFLDIVADCLRHTLRIVQDFIDGWVKWSWYVEGLQKMSTVTQQKFKIIP